MPRSDQARISDIIDAGDRIGRHIGSLDQAGFGASETVMRAVLFDLAVIGEAAKGVSAESRSQHPEVPWSEMAGMRDVVIHHYFGVDERIVWNAATVSVPAVVTMLRGTRLGS